MKIGRRGLAKLDLFSTTILILSISYFDQTTA
jgi:hypothetical protein